MSARIPPKAIELNVEYPYIDFLNRSALGLSGALFQVTNPDGVTNTSIKNIPQVVTLVFERVVRDENGTRIFGFVNDPEKYALLSRYLSKPGDNKSIWESRVIVYCTQDTRITFLQKNILLQPAPSAGAGQEGVEGKR